MSIEKHFRYCYSAIKTIKQSHGLERNWEELVRQYVPRSPLQSHIGTEMRILRRASSVKMLWGCMYPLGVGHLTALAV